jgi:hypothetical protein
MLSEAKHLSQKLRKSIMQRFFAALRMTAALRNLGVLGVLAVKSNGAQS